MALLLTFVTSLVAVFTVPVLIPLLLLDKDQIQRNIEISTTPMLLGLFLTVLIPLVVGKLLAEFSNRVRSVCTEYKFPLSIASTTFLVCIPWIDASQSVDKLAAVSPATLILVFLAGIGIHTTYLAFNYVVGLRLLDVASQDTPMFRSVLIMCSHKSFVLCVAVLHYIPDSMGSRAIMVIAALLAHFAQTFTDVALIYFMKRADVIAELEKSAESDSEREHLVSVPNQDRHDE
eukprot:TRINITY_DN2334_c0_g1_i1.p1 TRINITY_DN2334_c0_g1~~TRINITY_DN2334_c0_g1_i1.p1  ORF type:complete len:233 (-),score=28.68 TRINITY_DN2334_c0_g1_i1:82-780(-)